MHIRQSFIANSVPELFISLIIIRIKVRDLYSRLSATQQFREIMKQLKYFIYIYKLFITRHFLTSLWTMQSYSTLKLLKKIRYIQITVSLRMHSRVKAEESHYGCTVVVLFVIYVNDVYSF